MKKFIGSLLLLFYVASSSAQAPAMFAGFHDDVKPSMDGAYRQAVKNLKASCEKNGASIAWNSFYIDNNSYIHFVPIKSFADLDKNMFADMEGKIGKEGMAKLWSETDKCVDAQRSFIMLYMPNLSYTLEEKPNENFRNVLYWFPVTGKETEAEQIIMEWQKLSTGKKVVTSMQTYKIIFGGERGYAIVSTGANPAEYYPRDQKTNELFGAEGGKLWERTLAITRKYDTQIAWFMPDLSYAPPKK